MGNLLLTFPGLQTTDFAPWVEPEAAARAGLTVNEFASKTAKTWKKGIAEWGQDASRIEKFQNSVDVAVYTPGSQTGLPLTILRSFAAPSAALAEDPEAMRDRVVSAEVEHAQLDHQRDDVFRSGRDRPRRAARSIRQHGAGRQQLLPGRGQFLGVRLQQPGVPLGAG